MMKPGHPFRLTLDYLEITMICIFASAFRLMFHLMFRVAIKK